jgi:hypothetical protein
MVFSEPPDRPAATWTPGRIEDTRDLDSIYIETTVDKIGQGPRGVKEGRVPPDGKHRFP